MPGRHPRPRGVRGGVERAAGSPWSTPAAGSRDAQGHRGPGRRAGRGRDRRWPTPCCFVVDATVGATDTDEAVVRVLRRSGKPVVLAANKVDDPRTEADAAALWSLGLGEPYPVSALHGRGSGDLLDAVARRCCPRRRPTVTVAERRPAARRAARAAQRRQVLPAQQGRRRRARRRRLGRRHHPRPGRRAGRARRAGRGGSSTPPASVAACTRPTAPTSTRRCAPRPRSRRPRSPSSWSTRSEPIDRAGRADHPHGRSSPAARS